jgi:hypothetical protein
VAEQKGKSRLTYATVTSTIALLISCMSFYYSTFYEKHSLKIAPVTYGYDPSHIPWDFHCNLIILNQGNQTETILSIVPTFGGQQATVRDVELGPFVLKPGDAVPLSISWAIDTDVIADLDWTDEEPNRIATGNLFLDVISISG